MKYLCIILVIVTLHFCKEKTEYKRLVQNELNKGIQQDTLFLGYELGMEKNEFLEHSWELNQQKIITGNSTIRYQDNDFSHITIMTFFPEFRDNRIYRMPVEVHYKAWAPWNKELSSDSLITELLMRYEKIYGSGFMKVKHPEYDRESWIKIDGNRRISIYRKNDMTARVEFLDLAAKNE